MRNTLFALSTVLASLLGPIGASRGGDPTEIRVQVMRVPEGGIQPQAAVDEKGAIHVIWFRGDEAEGDLEYARLEPGSERFTEPVRVNSQPGSAIAKGTIRGGQLAVAGGR